MYNNNKILAIIPARSGSKGLKDKNIRLLNGKPLIAYTIQEAINSEVFDDILVSTDSKEYADISKQYGAYVPFLRPKEFSEDTSSSTDVILHVLNELKKLNKEYDYFMLLQPTSPLRNKNDILASIKLCFDKKANSIVSVSKVNKSPLLMNTLDSTLSLERFFNDSIIDKRRQDLKTFYALNGAIYLVNIEYFFKYKNVYKEKSFAYVMNEERSIDIDTETDFIIAKAILKQNENLGNHNE